MAPDDIQVLEAKALESLEQEAGHVGAELDEAAAAVDVHEAPLDDDAPAIRLALAYLFPVIGAGIMAGGVFVGVGARIWACIAGVLGIALALGVRKIRRPVLTNVVLVLGIFAIGLVLVLPTGVENITKVESLARSAATSGDVLRPPVDFDEGWRAIVGWLMGIVGFAGIWLAVVVRKPALAMLVPLPVAAIAAISIPDDEQVASGITVLVLFAVGLGLLSSARQYEAGARAPLSYEVRKLAKSLPLIGVITVALIALSQTDFLFPDPQIDPAEEPQKPKTVPLDEVEDRVLFEVTNPDGGDLLVSGPWRLGALDVYDGQDWRLPAFNDTTLEDVPGDGVLDRDLFEKRAIKAEFRVQGLGGATLPALPNTVFVSASGPKLSYDARSQSLRVANGEVPSGLRLTVASTDLPKVSELRRIPGDVPNELRAFIDIPPPPPAAQALIERAEGEFDNQWDRFDFLRTYVLDEVAATGAGAPVSITPDRVQQILGDTLEASPFEIVAMQAMFARWIELPSRIGYGFDGGDLIGQTLQVRPRHGASFVEVYFPGYKWLPVIGTPKKAKPTIGDDPTLQNRNPNVLPSDNLAANVYLPELLPPPSNTADRVRQLLLILGIAAAVFGALYVTAPALRKSFQRSRRRAAARAAGSRARIALAYAEWRDHATDFGFDHPTDTPLMFLDRFVDDPEHVELAWLTTRSLWGDLRETVSARDASAAEELSRALRRRLSAAQPATMRFVAAVSRQSIKHPYAPATDLTRRGRRRAGDGGPVSTNGARGNGHDRTEGAERVTASV